uniref:Kelch-like family member 38a n=1 Tax=Lates calcarifer TaxID=8187 RepID=A0A4W6CM41_LATCA
MQSIITSTSLERRCNTQFEVTKLTCVCNGNLICERILTDVLLCTEHQEIPCHRNVLVSSSPYFRAMFCSNFLESSQARVNLKGISSNVLAGIVDYVYTGCVTITMDIVLPLMQAASMLHYGGLFEACSLFLQDQLSPENCLSMIRLSEILHCESLRERAKEMAVRCFSDVAATEDFCELSLPELMCYLEDDRLCAEEEQVFETLLAWIHHDPFSRRGAIHDLFKKCSRELKPLWTTPRRYTCRETLVVVGGRKNNEQTSREALLYDERTHRWQWLAKLPLRLYKAAYVCIHSILYVLGGLTYLGHKHMVKSILDSLDKSLSVDICHVSTGVSHLSQLVVKARDKDGEERLCPCCRHRGQDLHRRR